MKKYLFYTLGALLLISCSTQKITTDSTKTTSSAEENRNVESTEEDDIYIPEEDVMDEEYTEERTLPELQVTAPRGYVLPVYQAAADLIWDIEHMDLELQFNWEKEQVIGKADLRLHPYFYDQTQLVLDAKGFEIISISDANGRDYDYDYDGSRLDIALKKTFTKTDQLEITINYIAKPSEGPIGGSAAITSEKGLFFINPRGEEGDKPRQIWTQGETENNSRWFPTIDKPNERLTHNIKMNVDKQYVTLSNGTLTSSVDHPDGTRTDHWQMTKPHAPYLVMIAVGDFAVVKEEVDGLLYEYYVEHPYAPYAKEIFAHTPEMVRFFSDLLKVPYPWDKYSQIITRDYVSGAMENTTAVIFGDFVQKTDRELIDDNNDYIVAHELIHHWFGNLVTCESWANLTLNEGFANYSEFLWQEYKYGDDDAGFQRNNEKQGYLASIMQSGTHPLIHYEYGDKEEMFDGHSYNKGGLVLHMLRKEVGDEAFYASLNKYLTDNVFSAVEVDELRLAFEDVTGLDLQWFFDQWFFNSGHPILKVSYDYVEKEGSVILNVMQTQNPDDAPPIFILPTTVSVYNAAGEETKFDITIDEREDEITLIYPEQPALIVFDTDDELLMLKTETKTTQEYIKQYLWEETYIHRYEAINKIKNKKEAEEVLKSALSDAHFSIRKIAVENVRLAGKPELINQLVQIAKKDKHSAVRGTALKKLRGVEGVDMSQLLSEVLSTERSFKVIGDALETLSKIDKEVALAEAVKLKEEESSQITSPVAKILADSGDKAHIPYFDERLTKVSLFSVFNFYESYYHLLTGLDPETILVKAKHLKDIAEDPAQNIFYKFTSTNLLFNLKNDLMSDYPEASQQLGAMIGEIKAIERNPLLQQRYESF